MKKTKKFVTGLLALTLAINVFILPASSANAYYIDKATLVVEPYVYASAGTDSSYYGYCSVGLQVTIYDPVSNITYSDGTQDSTDDGHAYCSIPVYGSGRIITSALSYHWDPNGYMGLTWNPTNGYSYFY